MRPLNTDSAPRYNALLDMAKANHHRFSERHQRSVKTILIDGKPICQFRKKALSFDSESKRLFIGLCARVKRAVNKYLKDHNYHVEAIQYECNRTRFNNYGYFHEMPGKLFWCIDIDSCYWQMAYRLGYIPKKLYEEYMWQEDDFKLMKHLALSFLKRETKTVYYEQGNEAMTIICDNWQEKTIYTNIVHMSVNLMYKVEQLIGSEKTIVRKADAIYLSHPEMLLAEKYLKSEKIQFKKSLCEKIDDKIYTMEGIPRDFTSHHRLDLISS